MMMNQISKVPVSTRAILQRINRALLKKHKQLRAAVGSAALLRYGYYYILDLDSNLVDRQDVCLKDLAVELKVLWPFEEISK